MENSFKNARSAALLSHANNCLTDEELVLLLEAFTSKNPDFCYEAYDQFNLEDIPEAECKAFFRFDKCDLPFLAEVLNIPDIFKCPQRSTLPGMEGLCILLNRMAYPCRYSDMINLFGRPVPFLSMATNVVLDFIFETHGHRITRWNNHILNSECLENYARAITMKGAALSNCFGFLDGTVRPICRPTVNQRQAYNGHKRVHSLKFQSLAIPNGIMAHIYGPVGMYIFNLIFFTPTWYRI